MITGQLDVLAGVFRLPGRATRAIVDLDAIAGNVRRLRKHVGPGRPVRAVVKGDGYGHGAVMVAETALASGAESLATATVGEAAQLRAAFPDASILILGPIDPSEVDQAIQLRADIMIGAVAFIDLLDTRAAALGTRVRAHLKIDTGMHRFGVQPGEFRAALDRVAESEWIDLIGVCTHHAAADERDQDIARRQAELFSDLTAPLAASSRDLHHANSAAALNRVFPLSGSIRLGIAMYGLAPGPSTPLLEGMRPAMSVVSRLQRIHLADAGEGVSYGHRYRVSSQERLGLIPLGYADGYRRAASDKGWVSIDGNRAPVRGRVCMDQTVAGDLLPGAQIGDFCGVAGPIGSGPSFEEIGSWAGTIAYEIATGFSPRIPRYYLQGRQIVATLIDGQ
ncbi:MAG: alanine racemase, partial [Chloroflexota bacterium]|nr:alanine racemase [Chloroflexota bacterium]